MTLTDKASSLCQEYGGLWKLVKSPEFKFILNNREAIEEVLDEYKEYKFCTALAKDRYFDVDGEPPLRTLEQVKSYLKQKKVNFSKKDNEQILRRMAYENEKEEIRHRFELVLSGDC